MQLNNNILILGLFLITPFLFMSCQDQKPQRLPYIGNMDVVGNDTTYYTIPPFSFINQDSQEVTKKTFANKIYAADFFFTSCPSICPKVKKQMLRIYDTFKDEDRLKMLSHSIDVFRDTVGMLSMYAENLGVTSDRWHFVTGDEMALLDMADDYFVSAVKDPNAPGGYDHSGRIILVDTNGHVRAYCDGTDEIEVTAFMKDIEQLIDETYPK